MSMTSPKRLVAFVEGVGDKAAVPILLKRLLSDWAESPWDALFLDDKPPFEVGEVSNLVQLDKATNTLHCAEWERLLTQAQRTRKNLGAVLLLLDGDIPKVAGQEFCPVTFARLLADAARRAGGGTLFSVAVVFLLPEYEALLIASHESLPNINPGAQMPHNLEEKRSGKGWLGKNLKGGYKQATDQAELTEYLRFDLLRERLKSFCRLERALQELTTAVRTGSHIVSPVVPPAPPSEAAPPT